MKHNWEVIVGNVGTVFQGSNGFVALQEFNSYAKAVRSGWFADGTPVGRAAGEPVTLMKNGEPWREYDPDSGCFFVEVTDTLGGPAGETNYGWVERYKVHAKTALNALHKAKSTGWTLDHVASDELGTRRYNRLHACICAFVCPFDRERHGRYCNVKEIA